MRHRSVNVKATAISEGTYEYVNSPTTNLVSEIPVVFTRTLRMS
jgi:hypothetical protein